jgi:hypothetical protein
VWPFLFHFLIFLTYKDDLKIKRTVKKWERGQTKRVRGAGNARKSRRARRLRLTPIILAT